MNHKAISPDDDVILPLTKRLVEAHGATFDLESEIAVGTTVTIEFPASRLVERAAPRAAAAP